MRTDATVSIETLKQQLTHVQSKIKKLDPSDPYLDRLSGSFHLSRVGGSGKNTHRLNKRRESSLEKTIANAVLLVPLYRTRDSLIAQIKDLESGGPVKRAEEKSLVNTYSAEYWRSIQVGDSVTVWSGNAIIVTKKNKKSLESAGGCKWTAAEIIGKAAAALL